MVKEVVDVATKAEESKEAKVETELPEDTINIELLLNTRNCVVL